MGKKVFVRKYTKAQLLKELQDEIELRMRLYPKRLIQKTITEEEASHKIARLKEVREIIARVVEGQGEQIEILKDQQDESH